jgi:parallel beta-helix repeat protein
MLVDDCQILMNENTLEGNRRAGFVCRNSSKAKMRMNSFIGNHI